MQENYFYITMTNRGLKTEIPNSMVQWVQIAVFMLLLLSKHIKKNHIGLYSDDRLATLINSTRPEAEKIEKNFQKLFKEKYLNNIFQRNLKITSYLDKQWFIPPLQKTQRRNQLYSRQFRPSIINH